MNYAYAEIGLIEVPGEISLVIGFTGCGLHCSHCHSKELWDADYGSRMTTERMDELLRKYIDKCSCVCFFGGEWSQDELLSYMKMARDRGFKVALYTGENWVSYDIYSQVDFLKVGPYIEKLGGLSYRTTNQRFYQIENGAMIDETYKFWN
jgi:anaerobic ribonucleoside-triphosphate reductase activating protein